MNKLANKIKEYRSYINTLCDWINDNPNTSYEVAFKKNESGFFVSVWAKHTMELIYYAKMYYDFCSVNDYDDVAKELLQIYKDDRKKARVSHDRTN